MDRVRLALNTDEDRVLLVLNWDLSFWRTRDLLLQFLRDVKAGALVSDLDLETNLAHLFDFLQREHTKVDQTH